MEHVTDGTPCWCKPDVIRDENHADVIVHKDAYQLAQERDTLQTYIDNGGQDWMERAVNAEAMNKLFVDCLTRASRMYHKAHPEERGIPDGAFTIVWFAEQMAKCRKE